MVDGVALYIRKTIGTISHERMLNQNSEQNLEWIAVEVIKPKAKLGFIVGTWFSPPGASIEIMNVFDTLLKNLEAHDLESNILDDFNYEVSANPLNHQTSSFLMQFIPICNLYQYSQLIQVPTRITASCSTLIDLFLTNIIIPVNCPTMGFSILA